MGYTIYYRISIKEPEKACAFIERICNGLNLDCRFNEREIIIKPSSKEVEPLVIKNGRGFVKTYKREPYTSIYLLLLFSLSAFGSVEVSDDEGFAL
ncbi:MAG: Uncharacterized protein XD54_0608 [Thermococcus sibiricus]|uniref:Uncharacterized protein n=1 Tax=Thermococcus sibiricus TaxID=172049 RepID=A0A117L1J7_9EURY|nr:MAG: Uncharacterized protein XD54_0608 [Thermococcus sibiricus]KUK28783.1 MAG: Uncharacterized protein XD61_0655 [Thermococcus sp. 40_45]